MDEFKVKPIGYLRTKAQDVPRNWTISKLDGEIVLDPIYTPGIRDIKPGDSIVVLFVFHKSPPFTIERLIQKPPHLNDKRGVFSTFSPHRPNPIGLSVLEVISVSENVINVRRVDMLDGTPIIDIKPYVEHNLEK